MCIYMYKGIDNKQDIVKDIQERRVMNEKYFF